VRLVDSHVHLDDPKFDADRDEVMERARAAGVEFMLAIGTGNGPPDLEAGVRLAGQYPFLYASAGVHPHDAAKSTEETFARLRELARHPKVVAIGEIGLDYHYDFSPRPVQRAVFERQLAIAAETRKPVVIHTREAWEDTLALWDASAQPVPGIMHCFTGDEAQARQALDRGFYLGFGGVLTFPKADATRQAARLAPEDRLLVETDCPYLAPVPHRGKRNEPAFVAEVARRLAELRGRPVEEVSEITAHNFARVCLPRGPGNL
jgi:TatD DNase family protein